MRIIMFVGGCLALGAAGAMIGQGNSEVAYGVMLFGWALFAMLEAPPWKRGAR